MITSVLQVTEILQPVLYFQSCFVSFRCLSVVTCLLVTTRSAHQIRSCATSDNNQTSYKIGVRAQHEEEERLLLIEREKAGHGDSSRYSLSRRSQWAVRCGFCRCIFYNRTCSVRLLRYPPDQKFKLKYWVHIDHDLSELGSCVFDRLESLVIINTTLGWNMFTN
jgi:hypothetical protein